MGLSCTLIWSIIIVIVIVVLIIIIIIVVLIIIIIIIISISISISIITVTLTQSPPPHFSIRNGSPFSLGASRSHDNFIGRSLGLLAKGAGVGPSLNFQIHILQGYTHTHTFYVLIYLGIYLGICLSIYLGI